MESGQAGSHLVDDWDRTARERVDQIPRDPVDAVVVLDGEHEAVPPALGVANLGLHLVAR